MSQVTAEMVKALREKTGGRMLDCQKALRECNGNLDEAMAWLRKKNLAAAESTLARAAAEGLLGAKLAANGHALTIVELTANTDFVAKNPDFKKLLDTLVDLADGLSINSVEVLLRQRLEGRGVAEVVQEFAGKVGENVTVRRLERIEGEFGHYIHHDHKQGAAVELAGIEGDKARALGKELSMHIVVAKPKYLSRTDVPADVLQKEQEIAAARLKDDPKHANKPPQILAKIAEGQLRKFYETACLLDQPFGDEAKPVSQFLKETAPGVSIRRFVYLKVGG